MDPCAPWRERLQCDGLVGTSEALAGVLKQGWIAARSDRPALLLGPTGTGKTVLARAIHDASRRAGRPFVRVPCPASPDSLFEGHLFGALRGAYTGAVGPIRGYVERARGGTLFLDEVGELPGAIQAKLLVLVEEGVYSPLGTTEDRRAEVRVLAATNAARLRDDLHHRLGGVVIRMPPLAERTGDVLPLAEAFADRYARERGERPLELTPAAAQALLAHGWPGNVRELEQRVAGALEEAWVEGAPALLARHVAPQEPAPPDPLPSVWDQVGAFEDWLVERALRETHGNVIRAARVLGASPQWVYKQRHGRLRWPAA